MIDLLTLQDHEPPMGDLGFKPRLSFLRALWTRPLPNENDAPKERIIHARILQLHAPAKLYRLGIRRGRGYHKCGSRQDLDRVTDFRLRLWKDNDWQTVMHQMGLQSKDEEEIKWFDLDGVETSAAILEIRRCGIDDWWPSWNLAQDAFLLVGEPPQQLAPRREKTLDFAAVDLQNLPDGVNAELRDGEVRYRSPFLEVGFYLNRSGFSYLALDEEGKYNTSQNLLKIRPGIFYQGLMLHAIGGPAEAAPLLRYAVAGKTTVQDNKIMYELSLPESGQTYKIEWSVFKNRLHLKAKRHAERETRAWFSSVWMVAIESTVSASHVLGSLIKTGETGLLNPPILFHHPGSGTFSLQSQSGKIMWRSDAWRPMDMTTLELKLGETALDSGDYLLPAGTFECECDWQLYSPEIELNSKRPKNIKAALKKTAITALTFRPDTATLSNNGISIHCPICMDNWSALTTRMGELLPGLKAIDFLQYSLERWLDGGPGYTSGRLSQDGVIHQAEDEYLMTGSSCLLGLADFIGHKSDPEWVRRYASQIIKQIKWMKKRDRDNDGLIESPYRTGTSGSGQWSTCWWDVISFGWKDAFANALLYPALLKLATGLETAQLALHDIDLRQWAEKLKANYFKTFYNPKSGWLAGWRCSENNLHDHAFLFVNGAAVGHGLIETGKGREIMEKLWQEMKKQRVPSAELGLPGNLWPVPDEDCADILQGYPLGYYQNGGRTHSQTRHFLNGLYSVGMKEEADILLEQLSKGLAKAQVFGGSKSGMDWRFWDDRPCGYEGLLTDQFGVLVEILQQYGKPSS
jgi:hypothetical protein